MSTDLTAAPQRGSFLATTAQDMIDLLSAVDLHFAPAPPGEGPLPLLTSRYIHRQAKACDVASMLRHLHESVEQAKAVIEALAKPEQVLLDAFQAGFKKELRTNPKRRTMSAEEAGVRAMLIELLKQLEK